MADRAGIAPPGFRLPDATRIGRVRLQVSDLERSLGYYQRILGLDAREMSGNFAALGPRDGGDVLLEIQELPGARPVSRRGLLGLYHFAILLPDRGSLGRFVAHLSEQGVYAGMSDHTVSEAVYLTDPDGLGIEVYADRPRESWKAVDRQLEMATKPLDVRSVVEAGGGVKWIGMPEGTRIGHVHFYVGDLNRAADFYHAGLGLDKIVWSYPGALFLSAGGYHHHVGVNTWAADAPQASEDDARLLHWEVVLPDRASTENAGRSIQSKGFEVTHADGFIDVADPWGIKVRLRVAA